ncbi:hypothetical protein [Stieleria varia]|uniref:Uncharacterized protein n=1 Tax=Stieleria varia TaxID=2528005 RepID=A0A5C6A1K5_9BACT|nr:hypothetical protein [Stieleria varia]TWT93265.1 hypothetical protein Pla52n_59250 [Stieleria varia]
MRFNGAGLARFHEWTINFPDSVMRGVRRIRILVAGFTRYIKTFTVKTQIYKAGQALNSAPINVRARRLAGVVKITFGVGAVLITVASIAAQVLGEGTATKMILFTGFAASQVCFVSVIAYACVNR